MSDFDKEAEREKLREKYERDKEERQATQRMSDLLLKGATMTNAHCGTCGDPLFQMDGTTFCPSCHGNPDAVEGTDLEAQPADESAADAPGDGASAAESDAGRDVEADREPSGATDDTAAASESDASDSESPASGRTDRRPSRSTDADTTADRATDEPSGTEEAASRDRSSPAAGSQSRPQSRADLSGRDATRGSSDEDRNRRSTDRTAASSRAGRGDLEAAHASLVEALEKFAAEAAATDDPRYARECLEAAREASETLETLR